MKSQTQLASGELYLRRGQAAKLLRINELTLWRWIRSGKISAIKNPAGRYLIPRSELDRILGIQPTQRAILYARVSSHEQRDRLENQLQRLREYALQRGYQVVLELAEIGSGLNENRKKLWRALRLIRERKANLLVVEFKDRLTRFGFSYLEQLIRDSGARVEVIQDSMDKDALQELVEDLISVVTSFCARLYGLRSSKFQEIKQALIHAIHAQN